MRTEHSISSPGKMALNHLSAELATSDRLLLRKASFGLQFEDYGSALKRAENKSSFPKDTLSTMLMVGGYDSHDSDDTPQVYAFLYGDKSHQVGYALFQNTYDALRLRFHGMHDIEFEEPFCDIGETWMGDSLVRTGLRAFILYQFLVAGYIQDTPSYMSFSKDLLRVCESLANTGRESKPKSTVPREPSSTDRDLG